MKILLIYRTALLECIYRCTQYKKRNDQRRLHICHRNITRNKLNLTDWTIFKLQ